MLFVGVCLACTAYSQKSASGVEAVYNKVENTFKTTTDVESLKNDAAFMSDLKKVIAAGNGLSARLISDHSTFIFMNGMLADVGEAVTKMPKSVAESAEGIKVKNLYNSIHIVDVGSAAPDFTLPAPDGKQINFKDFLKGKKCVLVDFWASWCVWCRKENPNVRAVYDEFKGKGFDVISVSVDTKEPAWRKALDEDKPSWQQVVDYRGTRDGLYKWYNLNGIPAIFLISSDGTIVAKGLRGSKIRETVKTYLNNH